MEPVREVTLREIQLAVKSMSSIPYFPTEEQGRAVIALAIQEFCGSLKGLKYTIRTACKKMPRWLGIAELRGIYCAGGFAPLDGEHASTTIPELQPQKHTIHPHPSCFARRNQALKSWRSSINSVPRSTPSANRT